MAYPVTELFRTTWMGDDEVDAALYTWPDARELQVNFADGSYLVLRCGAGSQDGGRPERSNAFRAFKKLRRRVRRRARHGTSIRTTERR